MSTLGPWMILGIGNPGPKYELTRHNAGVRAVEGLGQSLGARLEPAKPRLRPGKPQATLARCKSLEVDVILARSATFMNESGRAAAGLLRWFKVPSTRLIVLHDEIDLSAGALRTKFGGGSGGHRGIDSIASSIGKNFYRIRIGVGRPPEHSRQAAADFVLGPMSKSAARLAEQNEQRAGEAVLCLIHEGLEETQRRFNANAARALDE